MFIFFAANFERIMPKKKAATPERAIAIRIIVKSWGVIFFRRDRTAAALPVRVLPIV